MSGSELRAESVQHEHAGLYKSVVWVRGLIDALSKRAIDSEALFRGTSVSAKLLADSRARISLEQWDELVQHAMLLTRNPGLGIAIASTAPEHLYHIVGSIALACGSLRHAMQMFERYRALLGNTQRFDLVEEGSRAYFVYAPVCVNPKHQEFGAELALGLVYRAARRFAGRDDQDAEEVWFTHAPPDYAERYAELFRCPVRFGRPRNAIMFARACLDAEHVYRNPVLLDVLRDGAERLLAQQGTPTLAERVRAVLRYEVDLRNVTAARIAHLLKLDPRGLRHQLIRERVAWSQLVDEARCRIALDELQRGGCRLDDVARRIGFSSQSAFNRAFKRWTGMTPGRYADEASARRTITARVVGRSRSSPPATLRAGGTYVGG
jgi:AraC-like DNA-binding protein